MRQVSPGCIPCVPQHNELRRAAENSRQDSIVTSNPSLQVAIDALSLPGIIVGHRLISRGDENALWPEEIPAFTSSVDKVRRASGAARIVARQLLRRLGRPECALPRGSGGAPTWPTGITGSLAHDSTVAVAAVGMCSDMDGIGIDIEPAESLPTELLGLVATPRERLTIDNYDPYGGRLLFVAKEAVYKAVYPLDRTFLDHHDVEINFPDRKAITRNGRIVDLRFSIAAHIIALAFLPVLR
jgi:4'-phosphopantetheinyl transferase EntD